MELKQIKELMTAMGRSGTKKLIIKKGGFELHLEREGHSAYQIVERLEGEANSLQSDAFYGRSNHPLPSHSDRGATLSQPNESKTEIPGTYITSPMVGTFYSAPSPEDPPFIKVGDQVTKDTVVCIIEAMKVMNEIKAGISGTIAEVLVESGNPVEFATKLYRIQ